MSAIYDGTFTTGKQNGPRRTTYPFANAQTPDVYTAQHDRDFQIHPVSGYAPTQATRTTFTNLVIYSEALTNAAWTKTAVTPLDNYEPNPKNGSVTGTAMIETAANSAHSVSRAYTFAAGSYCFSVFVRGGLGRTFCQIGIADGTTDRYAWFDIANGAAGSTGAGTTTEIKAYRDSWWRVSITGTMTGGVGSYTIYSADADASGIYAGDTSKGLYLYGAQLVAGATPGAYSPTTSTSTSVSAPNIESLEVLDGTDAFAYLVSESEMSISGGIGSFTRRYARLPAAQVTYGSRFFNRPEMHDIYSGSNWMVSFDRNETTDAAKTSSRFTSRQTITVVAYYSATANQYTTATGHGFQAGMKYVMWAGDRVCDIGIIAVIVDAYNFVASIANLTTTAPTTVNVSTSAGYRYINGPKLCSTRTTSNFYLPGVSTGITTPADITIPAVYTDAANWLGQIVAASAWVNIETSELKSWQGPIVMQDTTEIKMSNALDTITP